MKLWAFAAPFIKSILSVLAFIIGLGWAAYGSVYMIVKAEGQEIKREVKNIRDIDMSHLDKRFDKLEALIKEDKRGGN
jgi:hypothetical protein